MKKPLHLSLCVIMAVIISWPLYADAKRVAEFKVSHPKGTDPHGIRIVEYQGRNIIICVIWEHWSSLSVHGIQCYDLRGKQLQIPQEELEKCVENMVEAIKFRRRYVLCTRREPWTLALLDLCISPDGKCCWPADFDKLTLEKAVWTMPLSHYTDNEDTISDSMPNYCRFDRNHLTDAANHQESLPIFTSASSSSRPNMFHVWGISGRDGKELAHYGSSKCEDTKKYFLNDAILDASLRHIVVFGETRVRSTMLLFYESPAQFADGQSCFYFNPTGFGINFDRGFFLSSDIFCFPVEFGGVRTLTQKCRALAYSFSKNRIIADIKLSHRLSNPCLTWQQPWCALSPDGKYLALGFTRQSCGKTLFSDDLQEWIGIYQLDP